MNAPDPAMPANFGLKYIFWVSWRWCFYNPLTILLTLQGILFQLALDYPVVHWLGTAATISGVVIAQIRNRGKDYSVPILQPKT